MNVVLVHHPWAYLPDFDRRDVESQVYRESHLVLRGHLHQQRSRSSTDPDYSCVELAGGSVYDGSKHPNGYQLIELLPDEMLARVHYRVWHNGEWIVDRNTYKNATDGMAEFSLQAPTDDNSKSTRAAKAAQPAVPGEYRKWLLDQCADIELLGLKVKQGQAVHLNHIYVPLTTSSSGKEQDEGAEPTELVREEEAKPILLLDRL